MPSVAETSKMSLSDAQWIPKRRNYRLEAAERQATVQAEETLNHPLKATIVSSVTKASGPKTAVAVTTNAKEADVALDPLSLFAAQMDPLSTAATEPKNFFSPISHSSDKFDKMPSSKSSCDSNSLIDPSFLPWSTHRGYILNTYTTSEKLSFVTVLSTPEDKMEAVAKKGQNTVSEKVRTRLEQLDDLEEGSRQETLNLSQQEFIERIEEMGETLSQAWQQDQRVKSLKIVIQCAKLLADITVLPFYPSKFVLVTDVLDRFGRIVFERLINKANFGPPVKGVASPILENITPDQVPESAKETCRNWFYKIASIRELLPRLYVEAAILKCQRFLSLEEIPVSLARLIDLTRGIGDPLVSSYARCYVTRVAMDILPSFNMMPALDDFIAVYRQLGQSASVKRILDAQRLDRQQYLALFTPACDWLIACAAHRVSDETLSEILSKCQEGGQCNSALLLNSILSAFQSQYVSGRALDFARMIQECESTGLSKHQLYRRLGMCVVAVSPPKDQQLQLLNDVWRVVTKLTNPAHYVSCAEVWMEYVVKFFGKREVNTMLGDIMRHMTPDRAYEDHYPALEKIVSATLTHQTDFNMLFSLDKFMPFVDMFQKESVKVNVCKMLVTEYISKNEVAITTDDPIHINTLMFLCRTMHDSVSALSIDDEVRSIGSLINSVISRVSYGRDVEKQLLFYVECRASFCNIDPVLQFLVQGVNRLAMETKRIVGKHTRKTAAFVRACAAYSFITIPSLNGVFHKLTLYLVSGQVALVNGCISQAEAFFKAAIALIPSVPKYLDFDGKVRSTESMLVDFLSNFTSMLLVMPDPPDQPPLYLIRGLLNILQDYPWDAATDHKFFVFIDVLVALSAIKQEELPYHVTRVDSNDALYGSDRKFINELEQLTSALLHQITGHIETLGGAGTSEARKRAGTLCLDLFNRLIGHADLTRPEVMRIGHRLWSLIREFRADARLATACYDYVRSRASRADGKAYQDLLSIMSQPNVSAKRS